MMVQAQEEIGKGLDNLTDPYHTPTIIQPSTSQPQKKSKSRRTKKKDTGVPQLSVPTSVIDEAVNEEMDDKLVQVVVPGVNKPWGILLLRLGLRECLKFLMTHYLQKLTHLEVGRIVDIDAIEDITLVSTHDEQMFDVDQDLGGEEVFVAQQDENVVEKEVDVAQIQVTIEQRLAVERARQEVEANIALTESWDDVQVKINANYQLAKRLQAEEQQELNKEEKAKLFVQLLKKRRKFFAAKRAEEKRNKPPTQAQQRKIMFTYLKNMEGKKLTNLKNKSFDSIQKMFDRAFKRVNTFVEYRTELVKESSKKAEEK
nr:hypothetical protein [Tanacetum cinerariifolium]